MIDGNVNDAPIFETSKLFIVSEGKKSLTSTMIFEDQTSTRKVSASRGEQYLNKEHTFLRINKVK